MSVLGLVFLPLLKAMGVSCSVTQPETVPHALIVLDFTFQWNPTSTPNLRRASLQLHTIPRLVPLDKSIVSLKLNLQRCCPKTTLPSLQLSFITTFINHLDLRKIIYGFYLIKLNIYLNKTKIKNNLSILSNNIFR